MATRQLMLTVTVLGALIELFNAHAAGTNILGESMTAETPKRVASIFESTRTVCIGRYVLDVPKESQIIYGPAELPYPIERLKGQGDKFEELIQQRREKISIESRTRAWGALLKEDTMLTKVIDGPGKSQKIIFGVSRASGSNYMLESYQKVGADVYVQEAAIYGEGYGTELAELNLVAQVLTPRSEDEVPTIPGICFDGAFIKEPVNPIYEYVTLGVRLNAFKDIHFSLQLTKKDRLVESDAIEPRIRKAEVAARASGDGKWYDKVKVFRQGTRRIGGWSGYEYLAWKPALGDDHEAHFFAYVSQGVPSDPMLPVIDIELDTGVKGNRPNGTKPSLTDDEALYVWEKLTGSIRPRAVHP